MRKRVVQMLSMLAVALLLAAVPARAAKNIEVEFSYPQPAASFNLYMDGARVCSAQAGTVQKLSCKDLVIDYGVHLFTLTAVDAAGMETKHSPAYSWAYSPIQGDGPTMINLSVTLENGVVVPIGKVQVQQ
jgi:hypothetical protein